MIELTAEEINKYKGSPKKTSAPKQKQTAKEFMQLSPEEINKYKRMDKKEIGELSDFADLYTKYIAKSAAQGSADTLTGTANLIPGLQQQFGDPNKPFRINIQENPHEGAATVGAMATALLPGGPITKLVGKGAELAMGAAPGLMRTLGVKGLQGAAEGARASAGMGETLRPEGQEQFKNLGFNAGFGAAVGAPFGVAGGLIPGFANKTVQTARKENQLAPALTRGPQEVGQISKEIPSDVRINLGQLVGSPQQKKYYSETLGGAPLSGVYDQQRKALNSATENTENTLQNILGGTHPSKAKEELSRGIVERALGNKNKASELYKKSFKEADDVGFSLSHTPILEKKLGEELSRKDKSWLKDLSPEDQKIFSGLLDTEKRSPMSLEEAKNLRGDLLKKARSAEKAMEDTKASMFNTAAKSLDKDIEKEIIRTGSKTLKNDWSSSNKIFREEYVPYGKNKNIRPVMKGQKELNTSALAKALDSNTAKVFNDLTQKQKSLLGFSRLEKAAKGEGEKLGATPMGLHKAYQGLDKGMREKLFTEPQRKMFEKQGALAKATESGEKAIYQRGKNYMEKPPFSGGAWSDIKDMAKAIGTAPIGNVAAKIMTSPSVRQSYVTGKPIKGELEKSLMKEFNVLNKAKYFSNPLEKALYYWNAQQ